MRSNRSRRSTHVVSVKAARAVIVLTEHLGAKRTAYSVAALLCFT